MALRVLFAMVGTAAFSVVFNVRGKNIVYAALCGGVGYFVYLAAMGLWLGNFFSVFLSSVSITIYAEVMARFRKTPSTLFLVAGMIPIVPGGGMYNCTLQALEGNLREAAYLCYETLLAAGAIAIGIIAVSSIVKLVPRKPAR